MNWTNEQQKVIDLRDKNILVSAAAGSGKTAVLVERIISMISEGDNPIDIDKLLIVTFTNAAAAEMRERIAQAIEKKISHEPENLHLQKQMMLIHNAQITTIHSFCLFVIRNYFNLIHIDPSFRVANESELVLLRSDVVEKLLEDYYEKKDKDFLYFVECFASGKSDDVIEKLILKLHEFSMSFPWPEDWLEEKKNAYDINKVEDMEATDWILSLKFYIESVIEDIEDKYKELVDLCEEEDGPQAYLEAINDDIEQVKRLKRIKNKEIQATYIDYYEEFGNFKFKALSRKQQKNVPEEKKDLAKKIRQEVKDLINDIIKSYFFQSPEEMVEDIGAMKPAIEVLINVTKDFSKAFDKKKTERKLVDFNDLEHFCLNILVKKEDGKLVYSSAADELAKHYEEILIDEYQDSNSVQETILNSVSRERYDKPNRFMVGDVKQSIYKFRLARPEIFMEKYMQYGDDENNNDNIKNQKIDLHKNFRSRGIVLNTVNAIFKQVMTNKIGNITYDDKASLYLGADFPKGSDFVSNSSEVILVPEILDENTGEDKKEIEAKAIALRIKELIDEENGLEVYDKETKKYKKAQYKDIVILLRTMKQWSDVFVDVLTGEGIPCYAQTQTGYFNTLEIKTILNFLRIIDNPRQDIPYTAILSSSIVGLNTNELARIRMVDRKCSVYEASVKYVENHSREDGIEDSLTKELRKFLDDLHKFRDMVPFQTINELIINILEETGYYNFAAAMPSGEKRKANIDMLVQKAVQFEETSYSGLFHFIRYIEKLHKYDVDFGEADAVSGSDNSVKIMSIHKSKGLEFPIVFVSSMGKNFNQQDAKDKILVHPDLGLGTDFVDPKERIKAQTLLKKVIQKNIVLENLGEELRVLYVALTRAKEKLILTGSVKKMEDQFLKWENICKQRNVEMPFYQISKARSYLDWVIPSLLRLKGLEIIKQGKRELFVSEHTLDNLANISIKILSDEELMIREVIEDMEKEQIKGELINWDASKVYDENIRQDLDKLMNYKYPYDLETKIYAKMTVTELKRLSQLEEEETASRLKGTSSATDTVAIPNFMQEGKDIKGASLGNLYHKILDKKDIIQIKDPQSLNKYLSDLHNNGNLTTEELKTINQEKLLMFLTSNIAERMRKASMEKKLFTERQFIMGVEATEINKHMKSDELVLIQGIIDVYFEEEGEIVLLDYKTDRVDFSTGEETLIKRYAVQLDYYERALVKLTNKKVKERVIYSFALDKAIRL